MIQVGGSWQNSDPSVREAVEASVVQMWCWMRPPQMMAMVEKLWFGVISLMSSLTKVSGQLLAEGGVNGGHGGRIETSGSTLDVINSRACTVS